MNRGRRLSPPPPLLSLALIFCLVAASEEARAQSFANSITVLGDSISRAFNSDTSSCNYGDNTSRVWATGDDHGGSFCAPGGDGTFSHAERLECIGSTNISIFNDAASGADMRNDFRNQATSAKLNLSSSPSPRYVAVFMGHNDACTNTTSKTGNSCGGDFDPNNYCRTTNAAFEREFRAGLDQLIQVPDARIAVLATVRASELCGFSNMNGCGLTFGLPCSSVWNIPFVDICTSLTDDCSDQRIIDMYQTLVAYNAILESVAAEYQAIPVGGSSPGGAVKAAGVEVRFRDGTFFYKLQSGDVSCCDCFHPADQAQALLSEFAWNGYDCSPVTPCCATTGNPLTDGKCAQEDHSSFYEGGFWPGDMACGNGILDPGEQCDDGNLDDGDCCSSSCTLDAAGTLCADEGNVCTDDVCDGAGTCQRLPNAGTCDDGLFCTDGDVCSGGTCVPGPPVDCSSLDSQCADGVCDDVLDSCIADPLPDGTACDDGMTCTTDQCVSGTCVGSSPCGDGIVDAGCGETCDEGAQNGVGGCCSISCSIIDGDADGRCDRDDECTSGATISRTKLILRRITPPVGDDILRMSGDFVAPVPFDPMMSGLRLVAEHTGAVLLDVTLPAGIWNGTVGWRRALGRETFTYTNRTATPPGGIKKLVIKDRTSKVPDGRRIRVIGKKGNYQMGLGDLPLRWTVVLAPPTGSSGECAEIELSGPGFGPTCALNGSGNTMICR